MTQTPAHSTGIPPAFYTRDGDTFVPTAYCIGPWDPAAQHGGPPAALLAGASARFGNDASSFTVVRVTVELLRPVRFTPLTVTVTPIRIGRQVHWLQSELRGDGRLLARATVVRVAKTHLDLPELNHPRSPPSGPDGLPEFVFPFFHTDEGYHRAVEIRIASGEWAKGPCTAWMRSKIALVDGQLIAPIESTLVLADATNGIAPALPVDDYSFVNPDISVHLTRPLEGLWLALDARSLPESAGGGLVQSCLYDQHGEIGLCAQSLVVRGR